MKQIGVVVPFPRVRYLLEAFLMHKDMVRSISSDLHGL